MWCPAAMYGHKHTPPVQQEPQHDRKLISGPTPCLVRFRLHVCLVDIEICVHKFICACTCVCTYERSVDLSRVPVYKKDCYLS